MRWIAAVVVAFGALAPAAAQVDPLAPVDRATLTLARVRLAASREFQQLPNCTCTMNVERSRRIGGRGRFELADNLRLEVALVDGKEVYSWPGARQFEDREIVDIVSGGAIGSGEFAGHARNVLLSGSTRLNYQGIEDLEGRSAHRFDFVVPMSDSRYIMRIGQVSGPVGYRGSFWADEGSYQLRRLFLEIFETPPDIPLESGSIRIDYEKRDIGGGRFLLPHSSESTLFTKGGLESINRTSYTNCRLYTGESSLTFDEIDEEEAAAAPPTPVIDWVLPKGLPVALRLTAALSAVETAIGDAVEFNVVKDAALRKQVWLERGARITMRVALVRCVTAPVSACLIALIPQGFTSANKTGRFLAECEQPPLSAMLQQMSPNNRSLLLSLKLGELNLPPNSSLILFRGRRLDPNYQTVWRTLDTSGEQAP